MQQRNQKLVEFGFFFFASFGAASLFAAVVVFLLSSLFSITGNGLSFSSNLWMFLFIFPATLAYSTSFISPKLKRSEDENILPMIIVGYGTYSLVSFLILLIGGRTEPALWVIAVLILVSLAMFNSKKIFSRMYTLEPGNTSEAREAESGLDSSALPMKRTSGLKSDDENKKPVFVIRESSRVAVDRHTSEDETHLIAEEQDVVIHLGPRK